MKTRFEGKAYLVGSNIDTDVIYPGCYLELTDHQEIGRHCFAGLSDDYARTFEKGGIVVGGRNFGCGSSREHAAIALIAMGASCVIADSFARIFFRNGINLGLPLLVCKGLSGHLKEGDRLAVDLDAGLVTILPSGERFSVEKLGEKAMEILQAGGIKNLMRARSRAEDAALR